MKNGYQFLRVFGAKPLSLILIIGLIACIPKPSPKKGSQQGAPDKAPPSSGGQADTSSLEGKNPPASPASPASPAGTNVKLAVVNKDFLAELPSGEDQRKVLCARGGSDKIRQAFCGTEPPKISSLKDLQKSLGLSPNSSGGILGIFIGSSGFVLTAHSSSLVGKFTSAAQRRPLGTSH
ncbi:MAG: hypothetical protein NTX25_09205 [Proteobacteria bacterium]|nr:hypothetical protein [Pseudomonadota bacterium]